MNPCLQTAFAVLVGLGLPSPASADDSAKSPHGRPAIQIKIGDESHSLSIDSPTAREILQALPADQTRPKYQRIRKELVDFHVDGARNYPLVGPARLVRVNFKCTVISGGKTDVIDIDRTQLITEK